jgi:hypothetical protein
MASQIGNVSRDGTRADSSTKCANGDVAREDAKAWNSAGKSAVHGRVGRGGRSATQKYGSGDQHACRLHVIYDIRKSVFTLRIRVSTRSTAPLAEPVGPVAVDYRACLPIRSAGRSRIVRESLVHLRGVGAAESAHNLIAPALQSSIG